MEHFNINYPTFIKVEGLNDVQPNYSLFKHIGHGNYLFLGNYWGSPVDYPGIDPGWYSPVEKTSFTPFSQINNPNFKVTVCDEKEVVDKHLADLL